jgi:hypothetical protein
MKTFRDHHLSLVPGLRTGLGAALIAGLAFGLAACGDEHDHDDHDHGADVEVDPHEEACEHMAEAAGATVTAVDPEGDGTLEDVTIEHARVEIELVAVTGGNGGDVAFTADEDNEFFFFLSADVPFAVFDASDAEVDIEVTEDVAECGDVAVAHTLDLAVGTYTLRFGPTTEDSVGFVFEEAGAHAHDHE